MLRASYSASILDRDTPTKAYETTPLPNDSTNPVVKRLLSMSPVQSASEEPVMTDSDHLPSVIDSLLFVLGFRVLSLFAADQSDLHGAITFRPSTAVQAEISGRALMAGYSSPPTKIPYTDPY